MKKNNIISTLLLTVILLGFSACKGGKKTVEVKDAEVIPDSIVEMRADQIKMAGIKTGAIEMRTMNGTLKVNGIVTVAPQNMASVSAPMGGFVKNTTMMPGKAVVKGQVLAVIENPDFIDLQQEYLETKSKLEYSEAEYKRQSELYKNDGSSQKVFQQATSEYKILKSKAGALEQKLAFIGINTSRLTEKNISGSINLVSPINGYLKTVNVTIGKSISSTDVLFEIVNNEKLYLELSMFEKDAAKVMNGQKIHFYINDETEEHQAVVYQTSKSVNADKNYKVYASVIGKCKNVILGMYVNCMIETAETHVTTVPVEAVVSFDDKDYIFVYERDKVESGKNFTEYRMVEVQKGVSDDRNIEIRLPEGFKVNTSRVVVNGAYSLLSAKKNAGDMAC